MAKHSKKRQRFKSEKESKPVASLGSRVSGHSKKRQRIRSEKESKRVAPLGSKVYGILDENEKDEEEKRLEALLFGQFSTSEPGTERQENTASAGLSNLLDSDLFIIDDGAGPSSIPNYLPAPSYNETPAEENQNENKEDEIRTLTSDTAVTVNEPIPTLRSKNVAWADPDDATIQVSIASDPRLRKLRNAPTDDEIGGRDYEARLRRQYEKINPVPNWASTARDDLRGKKRRRSSQGSDNEDNGGHLSGLLSSSGTLLSSDRPKALPPNEISIERLRDANQTANAETELISVKFHPSPSVPVLMTAGKDRRLRLFNIDGHTNPHLQSVHFPELPVTTALFHPSGSSILLTGHRPFYCTYDLHSGACTRSPRGLWGSNSGNPDGGDLSMETCAFSSNGDYLAVAGRRGYIHLVDWRRGGGQVVGSVKMNAAVKDLHWAGDNRLLSLGSDCEIYQWDIESHRCLRRWKDDGGFGSTVMTGSKSNNYLAIGATTGLVNLYGSDSFGEGGPSAPKPLKTVENLTTAISSMCFNHDAQILAITSQSKRDQLKLASSFLIINLLFQTDSAHGLGSFAFTYSILQLADIKDSFGPCHLSGFFSKE